MSFKRLSKADFNPPRPFLLGPLITKPEKYQGFHKEVETVATVDGKQYPGKYIVDVNNIGKNYVPS